MRHHFLEMVLLHPNAGVCKVFAQIRLPLIVVRGLRAPQLFVDSKLVGHGDPALQWELGCLDKNFTHPQCRTFLKYHLI